VFPYRPPPVLVPRPLRLAVNERVDKEGNVPSPLDETKVLAAAEASVTPEWGDRGLLPLVVPIARARAPRRRHPARGTPGCLCQPPRSRCCPESGSTTAWYVFGNRVAGSGLDRAPREHHDTESIHRGEER
jgi:hypothetical protein